MGKNGKLKKGSIVIVTDNGWGDTGKGKIVDVLAERADMVIRYNGGPNAGHTVKTDKGTFIFHSIPSGILHKNVLNVLANGVVVNPFLLAEELIGLQKNGIKITAKNFLVSKDIHMIMPWHKRQDGLLEKARGKVQIGTTGQGIGPAYADRSLRQGLRITDLVSKNFEEMFLQELAWQEKLTKFMDGKSGSNSYYNKKEILSDLKKVRVILKPFIANVLPVIQSFAKTGKTIIGEAGQGALLDLDLGGYPFVTSSNPGVAGFLKATGIHYKKITSVYGVTKAYTTRVGNGPMPTEQTGEIGEFLQTYGGEVGATTGRKRRCGWFDAVAMKKGLQIIGGDKIVLTKSDILDQLKEIKICVAYKVGGKLFRELPDMDPAFMEKAKPVYETLPGWFEDTSKAKSFSKLPKNTKRYIARIESLLGAPVSIVSVGAQRSATLFR